MKKLINNWYVGPHPNEDEYTSPELRTFHLYGEVEGKRVISSALACSEDGFVKTTSGSLYELGEVESGYEAAYPNAKERLLANDN